MNKLIKIKDQEITLVKEHKEFAELYISKEFFANGVRSYAEVYSIDLDQPGNYSSCAASASRLLKNANILSYLNHLLDLSGLSDEFVDKQLAFLITQNADFNIKLGAIREYNKLKSRITNKIDVTAREFVIDFSE